MKLKNAQIKWLKDFWYDNLDESEQYTSRNEQVGKSYALRNDKELYSYVQEVFKTNSELSGQIGFITKPLGLHADVLWDISNDHWQHWSTKQAGRTRYVVLDTDAKEMMHTTVFEQTVDPATWRGTEPGIDSRTISTDKIHGTELANQTSIHHMHRSFYSHHPEILDLSLSVDEIHKVNIGKIIEWRTNQLHTGQSFKSCGATYKLHLTVLTKE